ncbi:hypothetical protein FQN50_004409 [Emmonsiellopsis sp. PD_5]|nr:hypothetical protein FQN50_004409 [Emmonsiellopsis sp. PD_5]
MAEPSTDSDPMEPIYHEIDPNGDVLLIVREYDVTSFAVWDDDVETQLPNFTPKTPVPDLATSMSTMRFNSGRKNVFGDPLPRSSPPELEPVEQAPIENGKLSPANNGDTAPTGPEVQMVVSSGALIIASNYFKAALQGNFEEGKIHSPSTDGPKYHQIIAKEWDPSAMLILMNILHHRTRSVPRSIDLEMLAKIAVLVDYYGCAEAVEVFSDMWVDNLQGSLPKQYCRELVMWLWVAFTFEKKKLFEEVTEVAVLQSRGVIQVMGLPIPGSVIHSIDHKRLVALRMYLQFLEEFMNGIDNNQQICSFECRSLLTGCLRLEMERCRLSPPPKAPFLGLGFAQVAELARGMRSPSWPHCKNRCAKAVGRIFPCLKRVDTIGGVKLEKFKGASGGGLSDKRALGS